GTLWLVGNYNRLYKIEPFTKYSKDLEFKNFNIGNGSLPDIEWINLYSISSGILFSTSNGVYRFNHEKQKFYLDNEIGANSDVEANWVYPIVEDSQRNLWLNIVGRDKSKNKTLVKYYNQNSVKTLNPLPLNRLKDFFITSIHPENNDVVWFGGFDGLIRLDLKKKTLEKQLFNTIINRVTLGLDSLVFCSPFGLRKVQNKPINKFTYNLNSVVFEFSATDYASEDQILYQYKLNGFDTTWSNWTNSNIKEYTNLHEGEYKFELRAKNILNQISDNITYEFSINPPFFRTFVAYILYFITLVLSFILIGKWRTYYFARERFRLENIIYERTEEIVIQKEKADNLLERVLPKNTAKELKSGRKAGPYHYNMVTVLFSDIQGFTKI
ncbi:MAG: hypothetical protein KAQ75_12390, partial [Bacteroidales bacterium]|nr:hypothetical protein [Bacteroidales bacterium]